MSTIPPETTLIETASAAAADLTELAADLRAALPRDEARTRVAGVAEEIAEQAAELGLRLRCLPGVPVRMSGRDMAALMAFRAAVAEGEDIGEFIARALARLAWELGSTDAVMANRPGSWEAAIVADLLERTTGPGPDDDYRVTAP